MKHVCHASLIPSTNQSPPCHKAEYFKLNAVEKANEVRNREAARFFNVDESNIRLWRRNKTNFENCDIRKRADRRGKPHWPELEPEINKWILKERDDGKAVSTVSIRMKARVIAREMNIVNFSGGTTWCYRFMKRNNLVVQRSDRNYLMTGGKNLTTFLTFCKQIIVENNFTEDLIFNMDEVPLSFDIPPTRTVDVQGASFIPINTTGNERTSFTVVLCCAANGLKSPPMLIFKRKTLPKENFPKCVEIRANENGWMNEQIMLSWLQTIWRKRKNSFFRPKAFLIMDSMKSHASENVKNALKSASAKIAIIPGGLTKKLQPLDVGINRSFKSKVRKLWEQWMSDGEKNYTKTGKLKRASYENVPRWVLKAWNDVAETTVKNAFRKCNIIVKNDSDDEVFTIERLGCVTQRFDKFIHFRI
ncbi:pogo transposable element with KRAB domain [Trichonephila clavipes]|nr:pogo transposable element with KRAB domain [Trichonephila clavipes]